MNILRNMKISKPFIVRHNQNSLMLGMMKKELIAIHVQGYRSAKYVVLYQNHNTNN